MKKKYFFAAVNIYTLLISTVIYNLALIKIKPYQTSKIILILLFLLISLVIIIKLYFSKKNTLYNLGIIITIILNVLLLYNITLYNKEYDILGNILENNYKYTTYNIYVQKKNTIYNNIEKLSGKKIGTLKNNIQNINSHLKNKINIECISYDNISQIEYAINNGQIQSFIISENEFKNVEKNTNLEDKIRAIYTNKIKENNK